MYGTARTEWGCSGPSESGKLQVQRRRMELSERFADGQSWQAQGGMVLIESLRVDRAGRSRQEWICAGS